MLEITLMKTLYHEMDEEKIKEIKVFDNNDASKFHELAVEIPGYPEIHTMTSEVHYMAYGVAMYYLHINGDLETREDIEDEKAKACIYHFFKTYKPDFLKEDLPEDISGLSILDCFNVDIIPDYRPKYAFPGLVMYEDIKSGKAKLPDRSKPSFPGLRLLGGAAEEKIDDRPAYISNKENYVKLDGNQDETAKKLEELKAMFNVDALLKK